MTAHGVRGQAVHVLQQRFLRTVGRTQLFGVVGLCHRFVEGAFRQSSPAFDVRERVKKDALRGVTVPSRPPGLLLKVFDRSWHRSMNDRSDVASIDAHAEGDRGDHDIQLLAGESVMHSISFLASQSRVVVGHRDAVRAQAFRDLFGVSTAERVDDDRFSSVASDLFEQLLLAVFAWSDPVGQIRPVERTHHHLRISELQLMDDVVANPRCGGRGTGVDRDAGKKVAQCRELAVLGAEVMAPLTDAVGFIDRDRSNREGPDEAEERATQKHLGRDEEKSVDALLELLSNLHPFRMTEPAIEGDGGDSGLAKAVDLVLHQGDQGAHHDVEALRDQWGELVGEALSATRRHDQQGILPGEIAADRLLLKRSQRVVSPVGGEHVEDGVHGPSPFRRLEF